MRRPTHLFEIGRFDEETMAYPPGVTIKDYTWDGSAGYLNPRVTAAARFPSIIQIVPASRSAQVEPGVHWRSRDSRSCD